ncbi:MAG: tetratricopeptide repeat protein, partial [Bacteroidota bacterium]
IGSSSAALSRSFRAFWLSINDFDALIERSPKNAFYFSERGVAHHLGGDSQKALKDLDKAAELEPMKPFRYSSRAFIKDRMGDLEGAIADYERAIELDPEDAISYNNKGLVEEKMGYRDRSKKSFEKADELDPKKAQMEVNTSSDKPEVDTKKMSLGQTASIAKHQPADITVNSPEENTADAISRTLDIKSYIKQVKAIISDKEERGAFNEFVKQFFSRKR